MRAFASHIYICSQLIQGTNPQTRAAEENQLLKAVVRLERTMQDRLQMEGYSMTLYRSVFNFRRWGVEDRHPSVLPWSSDKRTPLDVQPLQFIQARLEMEQNLAAEVSSRLVSGLIRDRHFCHACHQPPSPEMSRTMGLQWMECAHRLCMSCRVSLCQRHSVGQGGRSITRETTPICPLCWKVATPVSDYELNGEWYW